MAQFCVKCGAPMGDGMQFCTSCGATVGAPPAPAAPAPAAPAPGIGDMALAPAAAAPPLAPIPVVPVPAPGAKKGSPVVKILLIVVAVIIFFMVLVGASCAYMFYRAKQKVSQFEKQAEATMRTNSPEVPTQPGTQPGTQPDNSGGGMTPGAGAPVNIADLAYPGATLGESKSQSLFGAAGIKIQEYITGDSVDTVVAYYRNKLSNANVSESNGSAVVTLGGTGGITTISIAPDTASGKTKITVSSFGKQ